MPHVNPLDIIKNDPPLFLVDGNAIDMELLSKEYGFKQSELTDLLHRKRQQVHKFFRSKRYTPKNPEIREKLDQLITIYHLLGLLLKMPDTKAGKEQLREKIIQWFRIPNPAYPEGKSPFQLVSEGAGELVVRSLMDQLHGTVS